MANNLIGQERNTEAARGKAIHQTRRRNVQFEELPRVRRPVLNYLQITTKNARTSVLSSRWRCMWSECPRLSFDAVKICNSIRDDLHQHTDKFIHKVNAVLQKHQGKVVETFEIRIDFVDSLIHHLDNWIEFAPLKFLERNDHYVFPFKLLNHGSISRLHHMQLSFVFLKLPSQFRGFPNLRKLYIQVVLASRKDLEHVLSHCCKLEWLRIDRCNLNDELTVNGPLPRLLYLYVEHCKLTRIKFHAVNLATFKYEGGFIPIDLSHSSKLQNAYFRLVSWKMLVYTKQWLWDSPLKFSHLRQLQLVIHVFTVRTYVDKILYLVSFLRATPFVEKLEVHEFGQCKYLYLKNMWINGFKAARGQVEFLLHVVENAPALEDITVDTKQRHSTDLSP
ncbi:hypothetical protein PAHAL_6G154900 [Panicum hallii]|uniref:At1g61320/AtMIF1 LRR domain-containing protein n=1 Tax=Panicum hallii TaxID=206008 RepID=A0A2T8IGB5_9POAL|nr:hypothetical protein PAHAL_6G154900 [Panicum hallii]